MKNREIIAYAAHISRWNVAPIAIELYKGRGRDSSFYVDLTGMRWGKKLGLNKVKQGRANTTYTSKDKKKVRAWILGTQCAFLLVADMVTGAKGKEDD